MPAAAIVTIIIAVLIILALVVYLVAVIVELRKITAGLDVVIGAVGQLVAKSEPVNGLVEAIDDDLAAGGELLEGLLKKKAGSADGAGLVESVYPGAGAAVLARLGGAGEVPNIDEVYTRGAVQLARLGRESPLGAGAESGRALRDPSSSSAAARGLYYDPARRDAGAGPRSSPTIGTDAPQVYQQTEERRPAPDEPAAGDE